jgi:hypothetical protein
MVISKFYQAGSETIYNREVVPSQSPDVLTATDSKWRYIFNMVFVTKPLWWNSGRFATSLCGLDFANGGGGGEELQQMMDI